MNTLLLGKSSLRTSRLAYGCWRIADTEELGRTVGRAAILAAYEAGYTHLLRRPRGEGLRRCAP
jgi:aryl-alcohol dehydrogenase-like predicted oxidoreductase